MGRGFRMAGWAVLAVGMPLSAQTPPCEEPFTLPGTVVTDAGQPLPDASVLVPDLQLRVLTGPAGRFTLDGVCPGSWRVRVVHLGYASEDREWEVQPGAELRVALRLEAVELEGVLVEVAPVMVRLEDRRVSHGGRSAVFDWRTFPEGQVPVNIPEWVVRRTGVQMVRCGDAYWGTRNCFLDRRTVRPVEICVDETESVVTPTAVSRFPAGEIGRAEFYRREGLLKIYTKEFLARAALGPWMIRATATQC